MINMFSKIAHRCISETTKWQLYTVAEAHDTAWQWKDKNLGGINSQREEEEEEWGHRAEELWGKTEGKAEEEEDIQYVWA